MDKYNRREIQKLLAIPSEKKLDKKISEEIYRKIIEESIFSIYDNNLTDIKNKLPVYDELKSENKDIDDPKKKNDKEDIDVVLIFALPEERTAAFKAFDITDDYQEEYNLDGRFYYQKFKYKSYNIISVNQSKMGTTMAASLATRSIMCFSPTLVVMTGICAGRPQKTNIGDILLASSIYDYTAGKVIESGKLVRPDAIQCDNDILNIYTQKIANKDDTEINRILNEKWNSEKRPTEYSKVHVKALGSGSSVIANGKIIQDAVKTQDDLYGIDMEGYGIAVAASQLKIPFFIAKGIQDFGDTDKENTEVTDRTREFGCFSSAVLASLLIPEALKLLNMQKE